ncbi:MAG TPA: tetratricopeptide repeat protein [Burkholderiales bacterium]
MRWISAALLTVALAGASAAVGAQPPELERAQALIREGQAEEAWQLLSPLEKQYAGQPDFDLALAMAATDSGRPNLATFALERVVVMQPGNVAARLELVRAFYALRDYERAERELQFILEADPPPEFRALAAQYRQKMLERPAAAVLVAGWSGYAEAGIGHDGNANVATAQGSIFVPSLGSELLVDPAFVREPDRFAALGAGLEYAHPLSGSLAASLGAELQLRSYAELDRSDSRAADLRAGLHQRLNPRDTVQYTLRLNDYELDHEAYRRMQSAAVEWRRLFGDRARLGIGAQGYRIRYRQADAAASSSDFGALAVTAAYVFDPASRTVGLAGLFAGLDNAVAGRADGDRGIYGATAGLRRELAPGVEGYVNAAFLDSRYRDPNPDFGIRRRDRQVDLSLGASWQLADGWFLRPQISRTRNASNIAVHDYARTEASLTLRREWD